MDKNLPKKIDQNLERLLRDAIENSDIKLLNRWIKILCSLLSKEIKSANNESINKLYGIIIDLAENLLALIDMDTEDSTIYLGPSIFEALMKIKNSIQEFDNYTTGLESEKNTNFRLTEQQLESLRKINLLI